MRTCDVCGKEYEDDGKITAAICFECRQLNPYERLVIKQLRGIADAIGGKSDAGYIEE